MTRALARTNFNSSRLVRYLADMELAETTAPGHAFAERLGQWLDFNDALALYAVLNPGAAGLAALPSSGAKSVTRETVNAVFARVRTDLAHSITQSCSPGGGGRIKLPTPESGAPLEIAAHYEPYRRFYLAHQRDMETKLRPLRATVREALGKMSPALAKLAALDAAFDEILFEREGRLLATVPALLEKRFGQLLQEHQQAIVDSQDVDDPATWMQAGGWLAGFCRELRGVLLAELDLRLQPTLGLMEAFSNETTKH